jgi:Fic family protein
MLYSVPALQDPDRVVLAEIEAMRDRLRIHLTEPRRWTDQLRRNLAARAIAGSNSIEGYIASVDDVEDMMAGEPPVDTGESVAAEIEGYRQAMSYIQRLGTVGPDFAYSKGLINALHFMMQGHHPVKRSGWWRTGPVYVTSADEPGTVAYTAPEAADVPGLTEELIRWLNQGDLETPVLVRAAMAHVNLVSIHPWADGNGRMSRALQTLVLAREGILSPEFSSIEEWLGRARNTHRYYDQLAALGAVWEPWRDTLPWVRFCLRAHHQQAQTVELRVTITGAVWSRVEDELERRQLPDRMMYALYPVAMGHRTRRAVYQKDAELSEQQALRDIRDLVRSGWLEAQGEAQARYYVAGLGFPGDIRQIATQPRSLRDPYEEPRPEGTAQSPMSAV